VLDRAQVTFFPLAWTIVHPITPESPLRGLDARTSYKPEQLDWNVSFTNIFNPPDVQGVMSLDISRLDETQPVA